MAQKTISVRPPIHAKLKRVCKLGKFGSLQNTLELALDHEIDRLNGEGLEVGLLCDIFHAPDFSDEALVFLLDLTLRNAPALQDQLRKEFETLGGHLNNWARLYQQHLSERRQSQSNSVTSSPARRSGRDSSLAPQSANPNAAGDQIPPGVAGSTGPGPASSSSSRSPRTAQAGTQTAPRSATAPSPASPHRSPNPHVAAPTPPDPTPGGPHTPPSP